MNTRYYELPRGWHNVFVITETEVCYIEVLFYTFYYILLGCRLEYHSLYRGLRYIEVRYIGIPPTVYSENRPAPSDKLVDPDYV